MPRLEFGQDPPPPVSKVPMVYIARGPCGHIVVAQADTRSSSLTEFVAMGLTGLVLDRVPSAVFHDEGICPCPKPEQIAAFE